MFLSKISFFFPTTGSCFVSGIYTYFFFFADNSSYVFMLASQVIRAPVLYSLFSKSKFIRKINEEVLLKMAVGSSIVGSDAF